MGDMSEPLAAQGQKADQVNLDDLLSPTQSSLFSSSSSVSRDADLNLLDAGTDPSDSSISSAMHSRASTISSVRSCTISTVHSQARTVDGDHGEQAIVPKSKDAIERQVQPDPPIAAHSPVSQHFDAVRSQAQTDNDRRERALDSESDDVLKDLVMSGVPLEEQVPEAQNFVRVVSADITPFFRCLSLLGIILYPLFTSDALT